MDRNVWETHARTPMWVKSLFWRRPLTQLPAPLSFVNAPSFGEDLPGDQRSDAVLAFLSRRRSTSLKLMSDDGPDAQTLDQILALAMRAPDHRRVFPWRFIVFEGDQRRAFGETLAQLYAGDYPEATPEDLDKQRGRLLRSHTVVALIASIDPEHKTPVWEQELSVGAVAMNLLIAATAAGFGANWLTEWPSDHAGVAQALELGEHEAIRGFFYLGGPAETIKERARPDAAAKISRW